MTFNLFMIICRYQRIIQDVKKSYMIVAYASYATSRRAGTKKSRFAAPAREAEVDMRLITDYYDDSHGPGARLNNIAQHPISTNPLIYTFS